MVLNLLLNNYLISISVNTDRYLQVPLHLAITPTKNKNL